MDKISGSKISEILIGLKKIRLIQKIKTYIWCISLILFFSLTQGCSKKEPVCACGVEHPEENLPWLKENLSTMFSVDVFKFFIADTEYIIISDFPGPDAMERIYDCDGILICEIGGFLPGDNMCNLTCSEDLFMISYAKKKLIYEKKYNPK